jgi:hypothetical protein
MTMTSQDLQRTRRFLGDEPTDEAQTAAVLNATGGTFTLTYQSSTTSALPYNASPGGVQNALAALSPIGIGNVRVINVSPYSIYFQRLLSGEALPVLTADATGLTGTTPSVQVLELIQGGSVVFTDDELNDNYDLAGNFWLGLSYGFRQLEGDAAKFNDYTIGQTEEKKSEIKKQLGEMADYFENWYRAQNQASIIGMVGVPPVLRGRPWVQGSLPNISIGMPYQRGRAWWTTW